jgi:hypothetical protein
MFQYMAAFHKKMCPFSTMPMAFSRCWPIHLACLIALSILLVIIDLCIFTMGQWCYYCVGVWTGYDYGVFCIVGMTGVICCGGQFSCSAQVVPKMPLRCFCGTFKCVVVQFVNGAPLVRYADCYKAQLCIGILILALFFFVLISKHLGVSV